MTQDEDQQLDLLERAFCLLYGQSTSARLRDVISTASEHLGFAGDEQQALELLNRSQRFEVHQSRPTPCDESEWFMSQRR